MVDCNTPTRRELRRAFKRHRGAGTALARELRISGSAISLWLRGTIRVSRPTEERIRQRALELLQQEQGSQPGIGPNPGPVCEP